MKGRIVKVDRERNNLQIGLENGGISEARINDCNYDPQQGDSINIYESEECVLIEKREDEEVKKASISPEAISINITNENGSNNNGYAGTQTYVGKKAVNKIAYCLLAFFLGGLGIQKFYSGRNGQGILCIVFCWTWIPSLIGIIDCIIGITKKADSQGNILI